MNTNLEIFDNLKFVDEQGNERWSTRKLQSALGYEKWQHFNDNVINRAIISCTNVGQDPNYHFTRSGKPIISGKGRSQEIIDYHVTRFAAFLIAMNGDPNKQEISDAQAYFAVMTLFAENILSKSPKEQLKDELGMLQFVHKVVRAVFVAMSRRWIVANRQRARYAKVAFDYFRLEVIRADKAFTNVAEWHCGPDVFNDLNIKGDIARMKAEIRNGQEVEVQVELPFDETEEGA